MNRIFYLLYLQIIGAWKVLKEQFFSRQRKLDKEDLPDQSNRTIVITGGNRGIGFEAVKKFLAAGGHVIVGCRRPDEFETLISKSTSGESKRGSYECFELDLMSLNSVRAFAEKILRKNIPIHVLINNAGIMFGPRKETEDGFESQLATNYLGHFLLTSLLLPKIREGATDSKCSRIINVSSAAHFIGSWMDFDDLQLKSHYIPEQAYGNSKAAQVMMTQYLDSKFQSDELCRVRVNCIHPGVVKTGLYTHVGWVKMFDTLSSLLMKTPEQGGDTIVHAAISNEIEGKGGLYLENFYPSTQSSFTANLANQKKLFEQTCHLLKIKEFGKH